MVIPSEHGEQMPQELFCILLPHGGKLGVALADERFEPSRSEADLPRRVLRGSMRKRIRGRWMDVSVEW